MAKFRLASALLLGAVALQANASELSLGLTNESVTTELELQVSRDVNATMGYVYSDEGGHLAQGAMHFTHDAGVHHFEVGANLSQVWADHAPNGSAVGLGGRYALELGPKISLHASGYYAPEFLSFGDVDGYYELDSHVQYHIMPNLSLSVGYRKTVFEYDHARDLDFEDSAYIGGQFRF